MIGLNFLRDSLVNTNFSEAFTLKNINLKTKIQKISSNFLSKFDGVSRDKKIIAGFAVLGGSACLLALLVKHLRNHKLNQPAPLTASTTSQPTITSTSPSPRLWMTTSSTTPPLELRTTESKLTHTGSSSGAEICSPPTGGTRAILDNLLEGLFRVHPTIKSYEQIPIYGRALDAKSSVETIQQEMKRPIMRGVGRHGEVLMIKLKCRLTDDNIARGPGHFHEDSENNRKIATVLILGDRFGEGVWCQMTDFGFKHPTFFQSWIIDENGNKTQLEHDIVGFELLKTLLAEGSGNDNLRELSLLPQRAKPIPQFWELDES